MTTLRRPVLYKGILKNKDGLQDPVVHTKSASKTSLDTSHQVANRSCKSSLYVERHGTVNTIATPQIPQIQRDLFPTTQVTEIDDFDEKVKNEIYGEGKAFQALPPVEARRRSSTFQRLKDWVKPQRRRYAICEEMERQIQTSGVSLRQYRKFLATSNILHDLKLL